MAELAHINGRIIKWARERRGLTPDQLAMKDAQAEKLSERLRIPFLMLFLSVPPEVEIQIPDLRTVSGTPRSKPSLEFAETVNDVLLRQDWYRQNQVDNRAAP